MQHLDVSRKKTRRGSWKRWNETGIIIRVTPSDDKKFGGTSQHRGSGTRGE